jgi:hypothetical protein
MLTTMSLRRLTEEEPLAVGAATLVAETVTLEGEGSIRGAAYIPAAEIVPIVGLPPRTPFTVHITLVSVVPATLAVNNWALPSKTETFGGEMLTLTLGGGGMGEVEPLAPQPERTVTNVQTMKSAAARKRKRSIAQIESLGEARHIPSGFPFDSFLWAARCTKDI